MRTLGVARTDAPPPPTGMAERVAAADLVIDATAHVGVQHYLSDLARHAGTAYLHAEATRGVWAGLIALYRPGTDLCWMCLQHYLDDETIPPLPASPVADVQPPGCLQPTYTGTGFDLATIAAQAVRTVATYLTGSGGYGSKPTAITTVRLRDAGGAPVLPQWEAHDLARHPQCRNHLADPPAPTAGRTAAADATFLTGEGAPTSATRRLPEPPEETL